MSRCYGEAVELFWCMVRQFNVRSVVHEEEFQLMRASFYFTHHIDTGALHPFELCLILPFITQGMPLHDVRCVLLASLVVGAGPTGGQPAQVWPSVS